MTRPALLAALLLALSAPALAAEPPRFPAVADTSFTEPDGDRVMQLSVEVPASRAAVWGAWTTREGWESFAVRHARVDFRVGGVIETSYAAEFTPGAAGNIENVVEAYVPERMLVIRNRKAPAGFADATEFAATATVLEFETLAPDRTRVTLTAVGFAPGPAYDDLLAKFRVGNAYTLDRLRLRFSGEP